jgi:hypothetical protein
MVPVHRILPVPVHRIPDTGTDRDDLGTWSLVRARRNRRSAGTGTSTGTSLMYTGTDTGNRRTTNNSEFITLRTIRRINNKVNDRLLHLIDSLLNIDLRAF